ncbi:MAG TPA: M56 family metallopeptidase [Mucilaginibacter sp.]|nr:M56 family metallopeptidase [Mucilaginibacter sp.]
MIPYILHVALLISVCLLFYKIFLQKETFYQLNRLVLLICLCLSFALPLISIPQAWTLRSAPTPTVINVPPIAPVQYPQVQVKEPVQKGLVAKQQPVVKTQPTAVMQENTPFLPIALKWAFYLYWAGVAAFGLNLLLQVIVLLYRSYSNPVIVDGKFRIIEVKGDKAPCSFGNNIFINPEKYDWETYNQILMHEKVHIQQGHSFDILLAELVLVFQWFNPFAWLYRGELENNLEFLTDEEVLDRNPVEKSSYQMSLLKVSAPHLALSVTTNYNQSLLKKRIVMMNAKKSNIHTMWKYFILLPLMAGLACALNQTVAYSQTTKSAKSKSRPAIKQRNWGNTDRTQGSWFATIKGEKMRMEFKSDDDDRSWSSNDNYLVSEFSALPKDQKGEFTLKREAGTMLFTGKFDGDQGYGHYKFTADKEFGDYLTKTGIEDIEDNDRFTFFALNIKREYVSMLKENGYGHVSKNDLISMSALKVDAPFIKAWKENGYKLSPNDLVSAKALGVNGEYVSEIKKAGYPNIDFNQLISFKAQGITAQYISSLKKAGMQKNGKANDEFALPSANDLSSYKALNVDSNFISGLKNAGYGDIAFNELTSMKAVGVTPEYAKSFANIGYKNISANELVSFKSLDITPEYVRGFTDIGFKEISANELMSVKSLGITPAYIKSFQDIGYKDISMNELMSVKSLGITPGFIKSFEDIGYKKLSIDELTSLKSLGVTHEYIKSFEILGYKQIPFNELFSLKAIGVTPSFIKGFKDIGYNVSLNEATSLKATGVTPTYVKEMKAKGFNSKDLDKYIQLKNSFN